MAAEPEQVVRDYWQKVWVERDLDALTDLVTDPCLRHTVEGTEALSVAALQARLQDGLAALRCQDMTIDDLIARDDMVWVRLTLRSISMATMAPMPLTFMAQYRVREGRITELWQLHQSGLDWHAS